MKAKTLLFFFVILLCFTANAQIAPTFNGGARQTLSICQNSGTNSLDTKLITTDPDASQTLTYTIFSAPTHGTVHGFPGVQSTGNGGIISPSGFGYTPTNGYNGLDSFVVNVSDGNFSAQTKIVVTINSLPIVNNINGNTNICIGTSNQLTNSTPNGVWSSNNIFIADVNSVGLVTAQAAGSATISYTVTNAITSCSNRAIVNISVFNLPTVQPITGVTTVCVGSTTQLGSLTNGGVWSSNNTTRATVNNASGLVTGVGAGSVGINYTVNNAGGCSTIVSSNITVNAKPNIGTISAGTTTICAGSSVQLTISSIGGTWSSGNTAIATVTNGGPTSGTVTGVAAGSAFLFYTITNANGCVSKDSVLITVNTALPLTPITGPTNLCVGNSIVLNNATPGGSWSVTPAFRSSITSSGVLSANTNGAIIATYSVNTGACSQSATYNVTAFSSPVLNDINGSNQVCVGSTTTLTNSTSGGVWRSNNTSVVTISNGGVVSGISAGTAIISYIVTNAANCADTAFFSIAASTSIAVNPILGASSVCTGSTLTLSNSTIGGTWASSDNSIAIVIGGTVTPIKAGVVAITYTIGTGACSGVASKNVIINTSPTIGIIDGSTAICVGTTSQLTNTTSDGVWSSSNNNIASVSISGLITPGNIPISQNATISYTVTNSFGCTSSATAIVTVNPRPNVQPITGTNSTCVGSLTSFIVSNPTGGVWTSHSGGTIALPIAQNPNNSASIVGIDVGIDTIYYTVVNGNGCSTRVSRSVTIDNTLIVPPITGNNTVCLGVVPNPTFTNTTTGGSWSSSNTNVLNISPTTGAANGVNAGTATVTYTVDRGGTCIASRTLLVTVSNRPVVPTISGASSVCVDESIALSGNPSGGKWSLQVPVQANFLSIDSITGVATGLASPGVGNIGVLYTVTNAAGCTRASTAFPVTVNSGPSIGQIQPLNVSVCVGATTTLSNPNAGGTWEVTNPSIATVNAATGLVTGVSTGSTVVRYIITNTTGCASSAFRNVTVNTAPVPGIISGQSNVCVGASTTFVSTANSNNWSSSNTSVARVNNGVVTGIAVGTAIISQTVTALGPNGCSVTSSKTITVDNVPSVDAISSTPPNQSGLCVNESLQLNNATPGGIWSSSNTSRATVNSSGLVTGVSAGAIIVTYTVSNGTCSATSFGNGTVYALPVVASIIGASSVCVGSEIILTNDSTGGVWSSDNTSLATVSSTGVVTAIASGSVIISYTKTNSTGCTKTVTKSITINSLPLVNTIIGTPSLCVGATTTLSNATANGVWSSANTSVATINNGGLVNGIAAGTVAIKYIVTNANGCSDSVSTNVTVNALPLVASIAGNNSVCVGNTTTLTNATIGGIWTSSNTNVATISSTTGILNGLTAGTTTIKYQVTNASGCEDSSTSTITVNALPNVTAITGNTPVCVGSTRALSNTFAGGIWTSNNIAIATINASGNVLGVSPGTATIKYQVTNASGCIDSATTIITVNALPVVVALSGTNTVCVGLTTTYSTSATGGVWSSSNTAVASVAGGVVTGVAAGSAIISYDITNASGCVTTVTRGVTVNAVPTVAIISGASDVCVNATTTLTNATIGGVWTSSNTAIGTIISTTGVVTGISAGNSNITYTVTNASGCINSANKSISVNSLPTASFTINNASQCINSNSFVFTNTSVGATISSWNFGDATTSTLANTVKVYGTAGAYNVKLVITNGNGCKDSVTQSVTVKATSTSTTNISICPSALPFTWNGLTFNAAGSQTANLTNAVGCDSAATLNLTVKANTSSTTTISICPSSLPFVWNGLTFNAAGTQTANLTNAAGCDSAATLNLTVKANTTSTTNTSICPSALPYIWNGLTFNGAGTQTANLTNAAGCDSAATLNLTIKTNTTSTTNHTACTSYLWNGTTYTTSGTKIFTATNSQGCDSTATLVLTINSASTSTTNISICPSALPYVWNGLIFSAAGSQTANLTNALGCDSAATLNLTVKANTTSITNTSICPSALPFTWNGLTFNVAGSQTANLTNAVGCDSAATLNLTVKANTSSTTTISICPSSLPFVWNGLTFNAAGTQTANLTNAAGCDSAATLNLTVKANTTSTTNTSICPSALPYVWNGLTFNGAGTQTANLTNAAGCDSAATLNLTIKTNTTSTTNHTACTSYLWNGTTYTTSGTKIFTATNSQGCDSTATLVLTINSASTSTTNISICPSALPFVWNGLTFNAAGSQTANLTNALGCDSAATLNLTVKANTTSITNTSICPSALPFVWNGLTFNAAGSQTANLTNAVGCDSAATLNLTVKANTSSTTTISICPSSLPFVWNGLTFNAAGSQTALLTNAVGCDSAATLNLTVKANTTSATSHTACNSFTWNGITYTTSGVYTYSTTNTAGCDSVATLNLTVNYASTSNTSHTACNSYLWNGTTYTTSGVYTFTSPNAVGCDSVASLNLTVNYASTSTTNHTACNSYLWNGTTYTTSGVYTFTSPNAVGCDSVASLNLTVNYASTSTTNHTACNSYLWNGTTYTISGVYTFTSPNAVGCDSVATLNLTVNYASTSTTNHTACNSYLWNGTTYTTSGVYTFTSPNAVGCDSVATLNLIVNYGSTSTTNHTACSSYLWNGTTYTTSGVYTFTTPNAVGCDSIATLNLTVNYGSTSTTNHTACNSYLWNGITYTTSGVYTFTSPNAVGCDSVATLNLTVNYSSTSTTNHTACNSYLWNGTTYSTSGVYTFTSPNAVGCDSVATLNLTVNFGSTSTTNHTACNSYLWNGTTYTTSGVYTFTTPNAVGCDSVATLNLTVNYGSTSTTNHTACNSYLWNGITYTTSGVYTFTSPNAVGCDSVATLNLTVNYSSTSTTNHTACNSYLWNGTTYTTSGVYTFTSPNAVGCDSVATLNLVVNYASTSTANKTICASELPFVWNGLTFNAAGSQTANFTNAAGCDSAATLNLTVNANPVVPAINGTKSVCVNGITPLSNTTASGVWSSSNTIAATVDNVGVISGLSAGTSTISYIVTNANNCSTTASASVTVNALPTVSAITGSNQVCVTSTKVLGNATIGGVWSSLTPAIATVTSAGVVGGVSVGGTTIKYTVTDANGCSNSANHILTVNALPTITPITGINTVCMGATTTLSTTTIGGSWSSNNTAIATVDVNGVVTGVASGVTIISYIVNDITTGCQSTVSSSVTVNALPVFGSINGSSDLCVNSTTTLSNTTNGGTWSSTNTNAATIDNAGFVTAVAAGTTTIKYIVSNGNGCIDSVSKTITVNDNPVITAITAAQSVCVGSNITASNITPNGIWTIGNNAFATIDASGLITGLADGVTFITYTVTDASTTCKSTISNPLTVNIPAVAPITGVNSLCPLSTSILSTTTTGGVWSSTDPSVATVDVNTGLVTAIANGVSTISYKVPVGNACGDSASTTVTVNTTLAIAPITGDSTVCKGSSSSLASLTLGGVWSSSDPAVATIDANTGVVSALSPGTSTITYSVTSGAGCSNSLTTTFTVDSLPAPVSFTAPTTLCKGATVSLIPSVTGGVWNSSPNSIVFVDNAGNANGVAAGIAMVSYHITNANGCSSDTLTKAIMVADLPVVADIVGNSTFCVGSSITLANDSAGGVWSSNNASVLSIDPSSGIVTSPIAGTATFSYTVTNVAGCVTIVSKSVTAFDVPTVDPIVGGNSVCVGSTITLASPTSNGVWSSLTPFVASINNAGVLTGNANGGTTIKYTVTDTITTCSNFASLVVTVNALPIVPAIKGASSVCLNSSTTLSNTTTGGTWSSNNTSVATVDSAGLVNGVGAGTATIIYNVTNASGCSTAVTADITVNIQTTSLTTQTSCNSYLWNGITYTTSGTYSFNTTNANGCDSVATLILTINYSTSSNTSQIACNNYTWNGTTYTTSGQYYFASTNTSGCSNIDTLNLTINYSTSSNTSQTTCNSYTWNGTTYSTSGQYYFASTNASGCSNIDTLNLTINYSTSSNTSQTTCNSYTWNGTTYSTSGQYYFASTNASGCSNIDTLNLTINYSTSSNTSQTACNTYTWNGTAYTTSGQYYFASTNASGCSNIDTLNLTVNYSTSSNTSQTACNSFTWNGTTYTTSGTYTFTSTNAVGCDSVAILDLKINNSSTSTTTQTACNSFTWNGTTYTTSGTYTFTSTNSAGCDSVATLDLTINNSSTSTTTQTACNSFTWNGTTYTTSGTYTFTSTNSAGCDSVATLDLTINNSSTSTTTQTACNSFTWNGTTYTTSGTYTFNYNNSNGCASVDTLDLTINNSSTSITTQTACNSFTWNGTTYTTSGVYTFNTLNAVGCDSVATLDLTINNSSTSTTTQTACNSFTWNGTTYTTSGTYTFNYNNSNGCASVDTLFLTINVTPSSPTITTSTLNITAPANGVAYSCATVIGATGYTWTYTGTRATIISGQGTENIVIDFDASATNGDLQVVANNGNCSSNVTAVSITVTPLPVVLRSFTATKVNNSALLKWTTASEINSKNFEVQRSMDARTFETIGVVKAKGFASEYSYIDEKPFAGINYYRLKQADRDGKFQYSPMRQITIYNLQFTINVFPNPATNMLNVKVTNGTAKQVSIFNTLGKMVYQSNDNRTLYQVDITSMSAGTYFVEILNMEGRRVVEKFVKQ
jgi:uncharacterized protein YjdB